MQPGEWQPIETAPRDGRALRLFSPVHGQIDGCWEQVDGGGNPENGPPIYWWSSSQVVFDDGPFDAPTHWMAFPEDPPKAPSHD